MDRPICPLCVLLPGQIWLESEHTLVVRESNPLTAGHTLVIPKRHLEVLFDLPLPELTHLWTQVVAVRKRLINELHADGLNIVVNEGHAAGQTIDHAHVHLIPRRWGEQPEFRNGAHWLLPEKARFW